MRSGVQAASESKLYEDWFQAALSELTIASEAGLADGEYNQFDEIVAGLGKLAPAELDRQKTALGMTLGSWLTYGEGAIPSNGCASCEPRSLYSRATRLPPRWKSSNSFMMI